MKSIVIADLVPAYILTVQIRKGAPSYRWTLSHSRAHGWASREKSGFLPLLAPWAIHHRTENNLYTTALKIS